MSDLVGNPKDRFSCVAAHIIFKTILHNGFYMIFRNDARIKKQDLNN